MVTCENCGWEIREERKHQSDGEGQCQVIETDTERVIGWSRKRYGKDMYRKK